MAKSKKKADNKSKEAELEGEALNQEAQVEEQQSEDKEEAETVIEEVSAEEKLQSELKESQDKYLRLYSEFENFRRRTSKEKLELMSTANEGLIQSLLPVIDDMERAQKSIAEGSEADSIKEGLDLVFTKFKGVLEAKGVKQIEAEAGSDFDLDQHEAITQIPAPDEKLKGKIVDVVEKGYLLGEKVIRFSKVVTGA